MTHRVCINKRKIYGNVFDFFIKKRSTDELFLLVAEPFTKINKKEKNVHGIVSKTTNALIRPVLNYGYFDGNGPDELSLLLIVLPKICVKQMFLLFVIAEDVNVGIKIIFPIVRLLRTVPSPSPGGIIYTTYIVYTLFVAGMPRIAPHISEGYQGVVHIHLGASVSCLSAGK